MQASGVQGVGSGRCRNSRRKGEADSDEASLHGRKDAEPLGHSHWRGGTNVMLGSSGVLHLSCIAASIDWLEKANRPIQTQVMVPYAGLLRI
jgi:hypothetical protein